MMARIAKDRYVEASDPLVLQVEIIQSVDIAVRNLIASAIRKHKERCTKDWEKRKGTT